MNAVSMLRARGLALAFVLFAGTAGAADGTLVFVFEPMTVLDLGAISAQHGARGMREAMVRERIAVRLQGGPAAPATARVSVALGQELPGVVVRVDGVVLSTLPRVIDPAHRVGATVAHDIEVTVPASVKPGPFLNDLQWFAETE